MGGRDGGSQKALNWKTLGLMDDRSGVGECARECVCERESMCMCVSVWRGSEWERRVSEKRAEESGGKSWNWMRSVGMRGGEKGEVGTGGSEGEREKIETQQEDRVRDTYTQKERRHVDCTALAQKVGPGRARGMQSDPGRERERHLESQRWTHVERWRLRIQQLCSGQGDREEEEGVEPVEKGNKGDRAEVWGMKKEEGR